MRRPKVAKSAPACTPRTNPSFSLPALFLLIPQMHMFLVSFAISLPLMTYRSCGPSEIFADNSIYVALLFIAIYSFVLFCFYHNATTIYHKAVSRGNSSREVITQRNQRSSRATASSTIPGRYDGRFRFTLRPNDRCGTTFLKMWTSDRHPWSSIRHKGWPNASSPTKRHFGTAFLSPSLFLFFSSPLFSLSLLPSFVL